MLVASPLILGYNATASSNVVIRLSVSLSCPSVCHKLWSSVEMDEQIELLSAQRLSLAYGYSVLNGNSGISKIRILPSEFFPNSGHREISPWHVDRRRFYQLSSTDDRHQFITLSIHLCVQHYERDAARRAGSSATAETCLLYSCVYPVTLT